MDIKVLDINEKTFRKFGKILIPTDGAIPEVYEDDIFRFYVTFKEQSNCWQIGYLEQIGKEVQKLECHPNTSEVFIPLSGDAVILLSINPQNDISAFKLKEPIVIKRGVWHGVISLTKSSKILIVESSEVIDEYFELNLPIYNKNLI
jgi:ureidoglycolate hydrolase